MATRADRNISLDGVATPTDPTPEMPTGADWEALTVVGITGCSAEKSNGGVCMPIDYAVSG